MIKTLVALALVALAGCIGRGAPVEEYLRVVAVAECQGTVQSQAGRAAVGIRKLAVAQALDRQSVMLAGGRVMSPSLRWYWEAAPGALAEQALAAALNCTGRLAAVRPVRAASELAMVVSGTVTDFQVQESARTMDAALELSAMGADGKTVLDHRRFAASEPVASLDAAGIADAGARALSSVAAQSAAWLEGLAARESAR